MLGFLRQNNLTSEDRCQHGPTDLDMAVVCPEQSAFLGQLLRVQISEQFPASRTNELCHARWTLLRDSHFLPSTNKIYYTMTFREQEIQAP